MGYLCQNMRGCLWLKRGPWFFYTDFLYYWEMSQAKCIACGRPIVFVRRIALYQRHESARKVHDPKM